MKRAFVVTGSDSQFGGRTICAESARAAARRYYETTGANPECVDNHVFVAFDVSTDVAIFITDRFLWDEDGTYTLVEADPNCGSVEGV